MGNVIYEEEFFFFLFPGLFVSSFGCYWNEITGLATISSRARLLGSKWKPSQAVRFPGFGAA